MAIHHTRALLFDSRPKPGDQTLLSSTSSPHWLSAPPLILPTARTAAAAYYRSFSTYPDHYMGATMNASVLSFSIVVCFFSAGCWAQPTVAVCPSLMEQAPPAPPSGTQWQGMIYQGSGESRLDSIMVFDGHPREMVSLRPDHTKQTKGEMTSTWHLERPDQGRRFWLACTYSNSSGMFALPLAPTIRQCRITQRVSPSGRVAEMMSFACS